MPPAPSRRTTSKRLEPVNSAAVFMIGEPSRRRGEVPPTSRWRGGCPSWRLDGDGHAHDAAIARTVFERAAAAADGEEHIAGAGGHAPDAGLSADQGALAGAIGQETILDGAAGVHAVEEPAAFDSGAERAAAGRIEHRGRA